MPKLRFFGIIKLIIFKHIAILSGTGVEGGSLDIESDNSDTEILGDIGFLPNIGLTLGYNF
jgi:hypothetical protein